MMAADGTKPQETNYLKWLTQYAFDLKETLEVITSRNMLPGIKISGRHRA